MDFGTIELDDDLLAFWDEVDAFLDEHLTQEVLDIERREGVGISRPLQRALGHRGWLFPSWPVESGGGGLDPVRCRILSDELARRRAPYQVMSSSGIVASAVRRFASDALLDAILPGMVRGEVVACLGYTEPDAGSDAAAVSTKAVPDGGEWRITGRKMFTTGAQVADYSMVLARSDPTAPKHAGLTMFLVDLRAPGVEVTTFGTIGGESTNMVFYDDVSVPDLYRLGPEGEGWTRVAAAALAGEHGMGAEGDGGVIAPSTYGRFITELLDAVLEWARTPGPNGDRPIDSPAVRRRIGEVDLAAEIAALTPGPHGRIASSEALIRVAADMVDLVGAAALPCGTGPASRVAELHLFAQGTAIYGGTTDIHRNIIAEQFLGLPRHRGVLAAR
jgi:alkylation response protein AidB-like acyl-CoA dehydrogenase